MSVPAGYELEVVVSPAPAPETFADAALALLADPNGTLSSTSCVSGERRFSAGLMVCGIVSCTTGLTTGQGEFGADFAGTWGKDLRRRAALPGSVFAVVRHNAAVVAHCMIAYLLR